MSFDINTNIASLQAQQYLRTNTNFQNQTINEVTSGLRIVNSGDDAAGLAIANGYRQFHSGSLNYDPKWHLRQSLDPIDLYVRHMSAPINAVFKRLLPVMEPTRSDPILPNFQNYRELWE